jgi:hypothetical protein
MTTARSVRRATVLMTAIVILFALATSAYANVCAERLFTLSEAYEAADSIIVGLVTECRQAVSSEPYASGGADCSFTGLEVLEDSVSARDYSGIVSSSGCGLSVNVGEQYLLFLDSENRPLWFSASLGGDRYESQRASQYLRILRDYRDRRVDDLAEPWIFRGSEGYCSVSQRVKGSQISFSRRTPDAPPQPELVWSQDTANGETVYRATSPLIDADNRLADGEVEIVAFGDNPGIDDDALFLRVSIREGLTARARKTTVSVGDTTWSLNRMEMHLSLGDAAKHTSIDYWQAGKAAEQILSAMLRPSDIVVTATLVLPNADSESRDAPQPGQGTVAVSEPKGNFLGRAPTTTRSTSPSAALTPRDGSPYPAWEEPAEPVIRVESRSTQLSSVIQRFRACFAQGQP